MGQNGDIECWKKLIGIHGNNGVALSWNGAPRGDQQDMTTAQQDRGKSMIKPKKWWFPEIGVPPVIIHFSGIFRYKPSSYLGTPIRRTWVVVKSCNPPPRLLHKYVSGNQIRYKKTCGSMYRWISHNHFRRIFNCSVWWPEGIVSYVKMIIVRYSTIVRYTTFDLWKQKMQRLTPIKKKKNNHLSSEVPKKSCEFT